MVTDWDYHAGVCEESTRWTSPFFFFTQLNQMVEPHPPHMMDLCHSERLDEQQLDSSRSLTHTYSTRSFTHLSTLMKNIRNMKQVFVHHGMQLD